MIRARLCLAVALFGACDPHEEPARRKNGRTDASTSTSTSASPPPSELLAGLRELEVPPSRHRMRVVLDAGHGAEGNRGNESSFCVAEEDFTLALAYDVEALLEELGGFEVALTRSGSALVPYELRVREAEALGAAVFVSLHSDVRGRIGTWSPREGVTCRHAEDAPGFSVLLSDEGAVSVVDRRRELAVEVGRRLAEAGFTPYGGAEYESLYAPLSGDDPGVFLDRHEPDKRVFVLRRPRIPSIIVETHNALDRREAEAWETPEVRRAFGLALAVALRNLEPS
jgi:N-acetylmuramoyl-L-alanine amidase